MLQTAPEFFQKILKSQYMTNLSDIITEAIYLPTPSLKRSVFTRGVGRSGQETQDEGRRWSGEGNRKAGETADEGATGTHLF